MGIKERIQAATSEKEVDTLLQKGKGYTNVSEAIKRRWQKVAKEALRTRRRKQMGITVKLNQAEKYQAIYHGLYKSLPKWKQELVDEKHDRQCAELAKEVIRYAEKKEA
jgi:hypothetical protein